MNRFISLISAMLFAAGCREQQLQSVGTETLEPRSIDCFWESYNISDSTSLFSVETDRVFTSFIREISLLPAEQIKKATHCMMDRVSTDSIALRHFVELGERYLHNPNSPMRNDELHIPMLEYIVSSDKLLPTEKLRSENQLMLAKRNRVGERAANLSLTLMSGESIEIDSLTAKYTLLLFNNPDCNECERVKSFIEQNKTLFHAAGVTVVAVYTDSDIDSWRGQNYPEWWVNGYDMQRSVMIQNVYNIKAIPTIYLLDEHKRTLFKDAPVEIVAQWLTYQI